MIHKNAAVSHITNETLSEKGFPGFVSAEGKMPTVWFTAEYISMARSRLPIVYQIILYSFLTRTLIGHWGDMQIMLLCLTRRAFC